MKDAIRNFWNLVTGAVVPSLTARGALDAIQNNRPLPVAQHAPLPTAQALPGVPTDGPTLFANRFTSTDTAAPVNAWVRFRSTWIYRARFDPYTRQEEGAPAPRQKGELWVQFLSYAMVKYSNVTLADWALLFGAPSKGKWLYQMAVRSPAPWAYPYLLVSPPTRKVTAAVRQANG